MAESTTHIIQYIADLKNVQQSLRNLDRINKNVAQNLGGEFGKVTQVISRTLDSISQRRIQVDGREATETIAQFSTVVKTADGSIRTLTERGKVLGDTFQTTNATFKRGAATTKTFATNIATLAKRAALTIPTWIALRGAITGVLNTIRDGVRGLVEFDRALQKARLSLGGTAEDIENNFQTLRQEAVRLSIETGQSVETIVNAFQRFATVGFDFETSLSGANSATKLAVTLFGDAEQNANAFARAFRILQDTSEDAAPASEQLAQIIAQTADLFKDNAFEVNELASALERFAPVANIANFSAQQTISVLAALQTAGIRGTRAGRLLGTSILQLDKNFNKISQVLGLQINPQLTTTFERFQLVLQAITDLNKIDQLAASQAVQELFGGVRGAQTVQALVAVSDILDDVLSRTGNIDEFNKAFERVSQTAAVQSDRFKTLRTEVGRAFVEGVTGADNFDDALLTINDNLQASIGVVKGFGTAIGAVFGTAADAVTLFSISDAEVKQSIAEFRETLNRQITAGFQEALSTDQLANLIDELEKEADRSIKVGGDLSFPVESISLLKDQLEKQLEEGDPVVIPIEPKIEGVTGARGDFLAVQDQQAIAKLILENQLDLLRAQGASNAEILKAEGFLIQQLNIQEDALSKLERQLNIEREINNEKRLQNNLSSETVKLFRIAQEEGTQIARQIGDVLAGDIDFTSFVRRGGRALEVFQEQFAQIFEQQQAQRFFQGLSVPGSNLRGGAGIQIQEQLGPISRFDAQAAIRQSRAEADFRRIQANIQSTSNINVNVEGLDFTQAAGQIKATVINELSNPESDFSKAVDQRLENF